MRGREERKKPNQPVKQNQNSMSRTASHGLITRFLKEVSSASQSRDKTGEWRDGQKLNLIFRRITNLQEHQDLGLVLLH